jgi:selenoprotein W-related protein
MQLAVAHGVDGAGIAVHLRARHRLGHLIPATGGLFQITLDGEVIWDRKERGGFPDVKVLKQMVRDRVWPERDLGHIDRATKDQG